MKIAVVSTLHSPILAAFSGGIEVFNYNLTAELAKPARGHEVVLFASGDSEVKSKLFPVFPRALFKSDLNPNDSQNMRKIIYLENHGYIKTLEYIAQNNFDIVHHSHTCFLPIYLGYKDNIPQILTTHMVANTNITLNDDLKELLPEQKGLALISISRNQAQNLRDLKFYTHNYHGIDLKEFDYVEKPQNYYSWISRVASNKGMREVIQIAIKANVQLKLAGGVGVGETVINYFNNIKKDYFDNPLIKYLGTVDPKERNELFGQSRAFIFPVNCEEPFGLVMIESMACGTPVIAFRRGAVPEIVKDGETGFICPPGDIEAMVEAVKKIETMPEGEYIKMRQNCRKHVEENFTVEKMVDGYEKIYKSVIEDWKK